LEDLFGEYGKIEKIIMIRDRESGQCKGFGFVYFDEEDDAIDAKDGLTKNVVKLEGRVLRIDYSLTDHSGRGARGGGERRGGWGDEKKPCRDWARGICNYGDRCRFNHDGPEGERRSRSRSRSSYSR